VIEVGKWGREKEADMCKKTWCTLFSLIVAAVILAGCGYHFKGKENNLPQDITKISIPVFKNQTTETNIETFFTNALISQFVKSKELELVDTKNADAVIHATIKDFQVVTLTYYPDGKVSEYRVIVTMDVSLIRASNQAVIWRGKNMHEFEDYDATNETLTDEARKQEAAVKIAKFMAELIHDRMLENF
jgi:outer membrane lipopolysaccharide assembly protein LptE/RlpB